MTTESVLMDLESSSPQGKQTCEDVSYLLVVVALEMCYDTSILPIFFQITRLQPK